MSDSIELHRKLKGKIEIKGKISVKSEKILSKIYTPGVAKVSTAIAKNKKKSYELTNRGNTVAIVTDGSRVLGLGNIGPEAAMPVMEGKSIIFKEFGGVDAYPICLGTQNENEIVKIVESLSPSFGAVNIEDIDSPKCFSIVDRLSKSLDIPVFHDDRHGTAIVTIAALLNALKVVKKNLKKSKIVIVGAGAAGRGITDLLVHAGARNVVVSDSKGAIYTGRKGLDPYKKIIAKKTNKKKIKGKLKDLLVDADVFIGTSGRGNLLKGHWITSMEKNPIVFAISNPTPEIHPKIAKKFGARVIATGRSDFPNQVNNSIAFPGFMKGILEARKRNIDQESLLRAAKAIASHIKKPHSSKIIPSSFDRHLCKIVSRSVNK